MLICGRSPGTLICVRLLRHMHTISFILALTVSVCVYVCVCVYVYVGALKQGHQRSNPSGLPGFARYHVLVL